MEHLEDDKKNIFGLGKIHRPPLVTSPTLSERKWMRHFGPHPSPPLTKRNKFAATKHQLRELGIPEGGGVGSDAEDAGAGAQEDKVVRHPRLLPAGDETQLEVALDTVEPGLPPWRVGLHLEGAVGTANPTPGRVDVDPPGRRSHVSGGPSGRSR